MSKRLLNDGQTVCANVYSTLPARLTREKNRTRRIEKCRGGWHARATEEPGGRGGGRAKMLEKPGGGATGTGCRKCSNDSTQQDSLLPMRHPAEPSPANPTFAAVFRNQSQQTRRSQQLSALAFDKLAGRNSFRLQNKLKSAANSGFAKSHTELHAHRKAPARNASGRAPEALILRPGLLACGRCATC